VAIPQHLSWQRLTLVMPIPESMRVRVLSACKDKGETGHKYSPAKCMPKAAMVYNIFTCACGLLPAQGLAVWNPRQPTALLETCTGPVFPDDHFLDFCSSLAHLVGHNADV
jgi:hypothetical protein